MGNMGILAHANTTRLSAEELMNMPGLVQMKTGHGEDANPSYISKSMFSKESIYGLPMFDKGNVVNFVKWLVENDEKYSEIFDVEKIDKIVGKEKFDKLWVKAGELDEYDFALKQQTYVMETQIKPVIDEMKKLTGVDITGNKALEELVFVTIVEYGRSSVEMIKESLSEYKDISEVDVEAVIDKVVNAKIDKLKNIKTLSERALEGKEEALLEEAKSLKELHTFEKNYKDGKEVEIPVKSEKISIEKELDNIKDSFDKKDEEGLKGSVLNLISKIFNK